jgi:hypothetical protein
MAMLYSMEARALASLDDADGSSAAMAKAEKAFERNDPTADPDWISYFNAAELAGEFAHCFRDLRRPEETQRFAALAVAPTNTPARTRAFINMVTAMGSLHGGSLEEAIATTHAAIELAGPLQSTRYRTYVSDFVRTAAKLHPRDARIAELTAATAAITSAAG